MNMKASIVFLFILPVEISAVQTASTTKKFPLFMRHDKLCERKNITDGCSTMRLKCPLENQVILSVKVFADTSRKRRLRKKSCKGWGPNLLTEINYCHWKNKCTIQFVPEIILKRRRKTFQNCTGKITRTLRLREYVCAAKNVIHDLCGSQTPSDIKETSHLTSGFIRSHKCYPWNYKMKDFRYKHGSGHYCKITLHPLVENRVVISVLNFDIYYKDDLFINGSYPRGDSPTNYNVREVGRFEFKPGQKAVIVFRTNKTHDSDIGTGSPGFLLCFKFLRKNEQVNGSVCGSLETAKTRAKRSCRRCRRRKTIPKCGSDDA